MADVDAPRLAERLGRVPVAATVAMTMKARAMRAEGIKVIALTIGEPDFDSPRHAIEAGYQAALRGRDQVSAAGRRAGAEAGDPAQIPAGQRAGFRARRDHASSNGGKQTIFNALMATVDAGDEVIMPAPYWGAYPLMTKVVGGEPVVVNCPQNNGFKLRPEDLEAAITPRTKWLILNFPNNPTGTAASAEDLRALGAVLLRHPHVWVMADDMYEHLMFDGVPHATMAAVEPRLRDRVLTISGVSKTYAMTGWRIGFAAGPKASDQGDGDDAGPIAAGVSTVGQAAAAAALDGPQDAVPQMVAAYARRRDLVVEALNRAPGISCHKPGGAFYVFPNVAGCLGKTDASRRS